MPELPEVEGLARFLAQRAATRTVSAVEVGAISALKTFRPGPDELVGAQVVGVSRHGKWLDLAARPAAGDDLHLVWHLARAGWVRWSEHLAATPIRPGRSPIALRVRLDDGSGFDLTEAGTRKRLAVYVVTDPQQVPQIASLGIDPLSDELTLDRFTALLRAHNQQVKGLLRDQGTIAGIGNAYSDEILHAARTSPFALTGSFDETRTRVLYDAMRAVLPGVPDGRQAAGRPAAVPAAALTGPATPRRGRSAGQPSTSPTAAPAGSTWTKVSVPGRIASMSVSSCTVMSCAA